VVAAMLATVAALSGCGSSAPTERSAPLEFDDGVATLDVPLSARRYQVVVAADRHVIVYGGERFDDGFTALGDGAVYDVDSQSWSSMPEGPFSGPLWDPAGVWTGREVIVVGTPCANPHPEDDDDVVRCGHAPVAAAFSPATGEWRQLRLPDLSDGASGGYSLQQRAVGWTTAGAVFAYDAGASGRLLVVDPNDERSRTFTTPTGNICAVGARLFAFGPDAVPVTPVLGPTSPMRTREWTVDGGWGDVPAPPPAGATTMYGNQVTCAPSAAAYTPVLAPPIGIGEEMRWFDAASRAFVAVPSIGAQHQPDSPVLADIGGRRILWIGEHLFVSEPDGHWSERSISGYVRTFPLSEESRALAESAGSPTVWPPTLIPMGALVLAVPYRESVERPDIGFIDLDRLPAVPA
jgi:hypothetical protein